MNSKLIISFLVLLFLSFSIYSQDFFDIESLAASATKFTFDFRYIDDRCRKVEESMVRSIASDISLGKAITMEEDSPFHSNIYEYLDSFRDSPDIESALRFENLSGIIERSASIDFDDRFKISMDDYLYFMECKKSNFLKTATLAFYKNNDGLFCNLIVGTVTLKYFNIDTLSKTITLNHYDRYLNILKKVVAKLRVINEKESIHVDDINVYSGPCFRFSTRNFGVIILIDKHQDDIQGILIMVIFGGENAAHPAASMHYYAKKEI